MRFKDRIALITGGSRGIGKAVTEALSAEGAVVVITYKSDRDAEEAAGVVNEIKNAGGTAEAVENDAGDNAAAAQVVQYVEKTYGGVDILVNNAGITRDQLLMRMSEKEWDDVITNNLKSVFNLSKAVLKPMMGKRYGKIVSMASVVGIIGNAGQTNYSASKAGVIGFTRALAREVASRNICVNAVAPGFIETPMTEKLTEDQRAALLGQIPLKRLGQAEDVARAVCFLSSSDADYITGQVLCIDGGMVMA